MRCKETPIHYVRTHWKLNRDKLYTCVCGFKAMICCGDKLTTNRNKVTCGGCKRTEVFKMGK